MKSIKLVLFFVAIVGFCFSQSQPSWNGEIGNIFYSHCSSCHHYGGLGTFPIMSYNDVTSNISNIATAITSRIMPPWKPDPNYRHFKGETALSDSEIAKISQWITNGLSVGTGNSPQPPVFNSNSQLLNIDKTITTMNYTINSNVDVYRTYVIPSNNSTDRFLNTVEFIPGNSGVVHHVILFQDTSNISHNLDIGDPAPGFASNGTMQQSQAATYVALWAPGAGIFQLPSNMGIRIPAGADFLIEVHYAPNNLGQSDSSIVNIKYTNHPNIREVKIENFMDWSPGSLINYPLSIPANQTKSFKQKLNNTSGNISVLSVFPHMHKIGKSYKIYTTQNQSGDTTKYIYIPHWDFHWQGFYTFQKIQVFPINTTLWGEAFYDNTVNNPDNPNNPPVNVIAGEQTTDEMMITFMAYTNYQVGDEEIILDSSLVENIIPNDKMETLFKISPNPCSQKLMINGTINFKNTLCYNISNAFGKILLQGNLNLTNTIDVSYLTEGMYFIEFFFNERVIIRKFIKQ